MRSPGRRFRLFSHVLSVLLVLIGILLIFIGLAANWLGLSGSSGFGAGQIVLAAAGLAVLLAGFGLQVQVVRQWARRFMLSRVALVLGGLLVGLLFVEIGLRAFEKTEDAVYDARYAEEMQWLHQPIPDPRLGVRLAPNVGGHDANGFRNDTVPDQADIVAIGDSQTYGLNASRSQAWPQTLAGLSGYSTYNMAYGAYGPVQYWALIQDALELSPEVIVIGLYFGNDLYGAYQVVYQNDTYSRFRNAEADSELFNDTISSRSGAIWNELREFAAQWEREPPNTLGWGAFFRGQSAILRLLYERGWWLGSNPSDANLKYKAWAEAFPEHGAVYEHDNVRMVLTTAYRLQGLDLDDPRIAEGLRITGEMLLRIHDETEAADVTPLILLIPTAELVYADAMEISQGRLDETYANLVEMEARARTEIIALCEEYGIEYVDALPALKEAVERNERIYPSNGDGHPYARGYYLIASAVNKALSRLEIPLPK